ncbi:Amino-acid carrier protein AlsT [Staphylococcus arlettae]|nr:Amino-acid carrier protein AlsT [Staphylococcus arlettae]
MNNFDSLIPEWFKVMVQTGHDLIWSQYLIGLLITAGLYFTISSKFVQLRWIPEMFRAIGEKPETLDSGKKVFLRFKRLRLVPALVLVQVILLVLQRQSF